MNNVLAMMRKARLEYAILRETDRQMLEVSSEALKLLVEAADEVLLENFQSDDARNHAAEQAEKSLHPVIASLKEAYENPVTPEACREFLSDPSVKLFPWTKSRP